MLGLDARAARVTWTVFLVAVTLFALYSIRTVLLVFILSILLAYVMSPVIALVDRFASRKIPRPVSMGVAYLLLIALATGILVTVGTEIAKEATALAQTLPQYIQNPKRLEQLPLPAWLQSQKQAIIDFIVEQVQEHQSEIVPMLTATGKTILGALGNVIYVVLIPILSFFLLKEGPDWSRMLVSQFRHDGGRAFVEGILEDLHRLLADYMRALFLISITTFLVFTVCLGFMGVPYSLLLAAIAGAAEVVPVAGPLLSGAAIVLVAAFGGFSGLWWIVAFLVLYRLVLDYGISPYIMGKGVALSPLAILFGILAGEQLGGIAGVFLAIPLMATLRIVYLRYRESHAA
ncbi:MAG: AI-2E family transporter [Bryobacteraceae bacterium]